MLVTVTSRELSDAYHDAPIYQTVTGDGFVQSWSTSVEAVAALVAARLGACLEVGRRDGSTVTYVPDADGNAVAPVSGPVVTGRFKASRGVSEYMPSAAGRR